MLASTAYAVRVGKSSLTFSGPIARRKSAATECVLSGNTSSIMPPPAHVRWVILVGDRPVGQGADTGTAREPDGVRLMRRLKGAKRPGLPRPVRRPAPTRPVL